MEQLPLQAMIEGDFAALGRLFRPIPNDAAAQLGRRLAVLKDDIEQPLPAANQWTLQMEIPVAVIVYLVSADGRRFVTAKLPGGTMKAPKPSPVYALSPASFTYVVVEAVSGAFVTGFNAKAGDTVILGPGSLRPLNNPGLPKQPGSLPTPANSGSPLPADSPPVLVATGVIEKNGNILARTQHWEKSDDSYSLPGCASLSVTLTQTTGLTRSTSTMDSMSTQVGFEASVGWGPISSSISASMSQSSTTTQDVTLSESTEATVTRDFRNPYTTPMVVFLWQLVDRILVIDASYNLIGMIETVVQPAVPVAYDSSGNPYPPASPVLCPKPVAGQEGA